MEGLHLFNNNLRRRKIKTFLMHPFFKVHISLIPALKMLEASQSCIASKGSGVAREKAQQFRTLVLGLVSGLLPAAE